MLWQGAVARAQDAAPAPAATATEPPAADATAPPATGDAAATPAEPGAEPAAPAADGDKPEEKKDAPPLWSESHDLRPAPPKPPPPVSPETPEANQQPSADVSFQLGSGFMRGGVGGLMTAQMTPVTLELQAMRISDARLLYGGALRLELGDAYGVAGIARIALRYPFGSLELRPAAGIPFYVAPRTMLGLEAGIGMRMPLSDGLGLVANLLASAFMIGNDVPSGTTVIMIHLFVGIDLIL